MTNQAAWRSPKQALQWAMSVKYYPQIVILLVLATVSWLPHGSASERFSRLNPKGNPLPPSTNHTDFWPCVLDRKTGLIWEVKTSTYGLHNYLNTFSWFNPDVALNGGLAGEPGGKACRQAPCDTANFIKAVNQAGWCNAHDWRLPSREELRSLVIYNPSHPGPLIDTRFFPNASRQFYWSADTNATHPDEAWGIGFTFGFDYAYYKTDRVLVRLVRQAHDIGQKGQQK